MSQSVNDTTKDTEPVIAPADNGAWTAPANVERVNATEPAHRRPDPTSRIVTQHDNGAEETSVGAASLGETEPGKSPLDYVDETAKRLMTPEEFEAHKRDWLDNPLLPGELVVTQVTRPSWSMLAAAGVNLFGIGVLTGATMFAVLQYIAK